MPPDGKHIHLTHLHLNTWAAAIVSHLAPCSFSTSLTLNGFKGAKEDGVNLEHPLNTKLFDPTFNDPNNISLLSRRRLATVNQNQPAPSIVINNDFKDLAAIMQSNNPAQPTCDALPIARPAPRPI
jgi:hypothetical protein